MGVKLYRQEEACQGGGPHRAGGCQVKEEDKQVGGGHAGEELLGRPGGHARAEPLGRRKATVATDLATTAAEQQSKLKKQGGLLQGLGNQSLRSRFEDLLLEAFIGVCFCYQPSKQQDRGPKQGVYFSCSAFTTQSHQTVACTSREAQLKHIQ